MPDWKAMYLSLMRDTEKAIRLLEAGQRRCEEMYLEDAGDQPEDGVPSDTEKGRPV